MARALVLAVGHRWCLGPRRESVLGAEITQNRRDSRCAFFIKDVIGPDGCVSISDEAKGESGDVEGHTKTGGLILHHGNLDSEGKFIKEDKYISTAEEPDHDGLCLLEQEYFSRAILEDLDLTDHLNDAINSLKIVLAADESFKTGKTIVL